MLQKTDLKNRKILEKYSSAFTLSDMEIFIFPELFYSLVLANIMSPIIWKWRHDKWFKDIHKKKFNQKVNRIKQFIMDNYVFNLDLETWGLTTKDNEISRFNDFCNIDLLKQSNALFGYEGDKYYFSIDIRRHFGLDKYNSEVIPYWKTETVEAMSAFKYKKEYTTGAGECVSLSALYAAAIFIIGGIPLDDIFLIATPLHSQNYIDKQDGIITNNRRIVTKNMWFNGTSLSMKARRALENERITIVSHISGYNHILYEQATIAPDAYKRFRNSITKYLKTDVTPEVFSNFLRYEMKFKKCFQFRCNINGKDHYIPLEKIFEYEHESNNSFTANSRNALLKELDCEEFYIYPIKDKILLNDWEEYLAQNGDKEIEELEEYFMTHFVVKKCKRMRRMFEKLRNFVEVVPNFPESTKTYIETNKLNINTQQNREEIIAHINEMAGKNEIAALTQYVYRQMDSIDWRPFIKAAIERNPVCINELDCNKPDDVYDCMQNLTNESIYDGCRLAQPDEVWNYQRGDGIEKAFLLANFCINQQLSNSIEINIKNNKAVLIIDHKEFHFNSTKRLEYITKIQ